MELLTSFPLLPSLLASGLIAYISYILIISPLFLHPLRHIPSAHWSIPLFGDIWILYQRWHERNNAVTYAAHLKHGPVVRMGRNELSANCVDNGIKIIYGGGWEKHEWYARMFANYGIINMFSTIHHTPHSQKKRLLANVYSKSYIQSSPQVTANSRVLLSQRFLPLIESMARSSEPVDVHEMNNAFTMDFMSAYQFGLDCSTNLTQDVSLRRHFLHLYHCRRGYAIYSAEFPWLKSLSRRIGFQLIPRFVDEANDWLEAFGARLCQSADGWAKRCTAEVSIDGDNVGNDPIVYRQFKQGLQKLREKDDFAGKELYGPEEKLKNANTEKSTTLEIWSEMLDHLTAGHETSGIALTYLYWEMSKRSALQQALRDELLSLEPPILWPAHSSSFQLPEPKQIDSLPVLHAIVMETLRLHAPIPGFEPRVSPQPDSPAGNRLGDYTGIPGGVRVSSMPCALHRNLEVFTSPEEFDCRRWLPASHKDAISSEPQLKEMHRWFWAFGSGGRMCIGSNLALQEIKLIVAAIYANYTTEIVDDGGIEELDAYTTRPTSNKLILRFKHV